MINDLKLVDGVLYQLTPKDKRWLPVAGQAVARGRSSTYVVDIDVGGPLTAAGRDAVNRLAGTMHAAAQDGQPVAQSDGMRFVVDNWKSLAATRKQRNNELADMMRTARAERDALAQSLATVTKDRDELRRLTNVWGTRAAQLSVKANALREALQKMVQLAKCYIPAGHKNSIVEDAIKVLEDTK